MATLAIISLVVVLPVVAGIGIDRFLLNRDKGRLHDCLVKVWFRLEETPGLDLSKLTAGWKITIYDCLLRRRWRTIRSLASRTNRRYIPDAGADNSAYSLVFFLRVAVEEL